MQHNVEVSSQTKKQKRSEIKGKKNQTNNIIDLSKQKIKIKPPDLGHQHLPHFESITQRIFHVHLMSHRVEVCFQTKKQKEK